MGIIILINNKIVIATAIKNRNYHQNKLIKNNQNPKKTNLGSIERVRFLRFLMQLRILMKVKMQMVVVLEWEKTTNINILSKIANLIFKNKMPIDK